MKKLLRAHLQALRCASQLSLHSHGNAWTLSVSLSENWAKGRYQLASSQLSIFFAKVNSMQNVKEKRNLTLGFNWKAKVCFPSTTSLSLSLRSLPLSIKGLLSNSSSSSNSMELTQKHVFEQEERQNLSNTQPSLPISTFHYYHSHSNLDSKPTLKSQPIKKLIACYRGGEKQMRLRSNFMGETKVHRTQRILSKIIIENRDCAIGTCHVMNHQTLTKLKSTKDRRYQPLSVIKGETWFHKRLIHCLGHGRNKCVSKEERHDS